MATRKTTPKPSPAAASQPQPGRSNRNFILGALGVILLLSALQFFLLHTVSSPNLKPLDPKNEIRLQVVRILDLDFPFQSDAEFSSYLKHLSETVKNKTGYTVVFEQNRKIISDEFSTAQDIFSDSKAADAWFSSQLAVSKGWQTNFTWLSPIIQNPASRRILEKYYGTNDLTRRVTRDFTRKITSLINLTGPRGKRLFDTPRRQALSSTAWWHYLLGKQSEGDLVVANYPIFYPSALTPADAVTRGGLVTSMIAPSSRPIGAAIAVSSWPVYGRRQYHRDTAQKILGEISAQALARVLLRRGLELDKPLSLLYPVLGEDLNTWYNNGSREPATSSATPVQRF